MEAQARQEHHSIHVANVHSHKFKKDLESTSHAIDKKKEDRTYEISRQEKELRHHLHDLREQQKRHRLAGEDSVTNSIDDDSSANLHWGTPRHGRRRSEGVSESADHHRRRLSDASSSARHQATDAGAISSRTEAMRARRSSIQQDASAIQEVHAANGPLQAGTSKQVPQAADPRRRHSLAHSFTPGGRRRSSFGLGTRDSSTHRVDSATLDNYFRLMSSHENIDSAARLEEKQSSTHTPLHSQRRSERRKTLALEAILKQLPSYKKHQYDFDPKEYLNCRYLRLTKSNIDELERQCFDMGVDPGIHPHLTEEQVQDILDDPAFDHTGTLRKDTVVSKPQASRQGIKQMRTGWSRPSIHRQPQHGVASKTPGSFSSQSGIMARRKSLFH